MKFKTFKQLNAERAHRRARPKKKIKQKNQGSSSQAGGPAHKESGHERPSLTGPKL